MKIYDVEGFPNPARIRIALAEKGILEEVEFVNVDVLNGEHRQAKFLAKNPDAAVPVLELTSGVTISECTAITEYLDHTYEGISLTGTSALERAQVHMFQRRAEARVLDAVGGYYHHATEGLGPKLETYQNKDWGDKQKQRALAGMTYFNEVLSNTPYAAGEHFSMADITLFAGLAFADFANIAINEDLTHLLAWRQKIAERPSIAA
jgi:glutathione S-transferase